MHVGDIQIDSLIDGEAVLDPHAGIFVGEHPPSFATPAPHRKASAALTASRPPSPAEPDEVPRVGVGSNLHSPRGTDGHERGAG